MGVSIFDFQTEGTKRNVSMILLLMLVAMARGLPSGPTQDFDMQIQGVFKD